MIDAAAIFDALVSHALSLGLFDRVASHEPENAPGNGLTCVFVLDPAFLRPDPQRSGLASTSVRLTLRAQILQPVSTEPADANDAVLLDATSRLIAAYHGDFELGDRVHAVDLLGMSGPGVSADAAYLEIDGRMYRAVSIPIPMIVSDVWSQSP